MVPQKVRMDSNRNTHSDNLGPGRHRLFLRAQSVVPCGYGRVFGCASNDFRLGFLCDEKRRRKIGRFEPSGLREAIVEFRYNRSADVESSSAVVQPVSFHLDPYLRGHSHALFGRIRLEN